MKEAVKGLGLKVLGLALFGGLGFMSESEVSRQYRDVRLLGIGGGTTEILTTLAGRRLGYTA